MSQLQQKPPILSSNITSQNAVFGQIYNVVSFCFELCSDSPIVADLVPTHLGVVCLSAIHFQPSTMTVLQFVLYSYLCMAFISYNQQVVHITYSSRSAKCALLVSLQDFGKDTISLYSESL